MKHLCAECGKSTHGFQCAYRIPTDRQGDNRDGVVVNASLLSQKAQDDVKEHHCDGISYVVNLWAMLQDLQWER
jgi:hypothetical protein